MKRFLKNIFYSVLLLPLLLTPTIAFAATCYGPSDCVLPEICSSVIDGHIPGVCQMQDVQRRPSRVRETELLRSRSYGRRRTVDEQPKSVGRRQSLLDRRQSLIRRQGRSVNQRTVWRRNWRMNQYAEQRQRVQHVRSVDQDKSTTQRMLLRRLFRLRKS